MNVNKSIEVVVGSTTPKENETHTNKNKQTNKTDGSFFCSVYYSNSGNFKIFLAEIACRLGNNFTETFLTFSTSAIIISSHVGASKRQLLG